MTTKQQPDPSPPETRPAPPPSLLTYLALMAMAVILIVVAFVMKGPDWPGLLINFASGIITAIMFLIIIDRRIRAGEITSFQNRTSTFTTRVASVVSANIADTIGYARVFAYQVRKIRPEYYVERPEFENLLDEYPNGFLLYGLAGIGKSTLVQAIAAKQAEKLIINPKGKPIPVLIPVRHWRKGNIIEQIQTEIDKYYPVRAKVLRDWLRNKPVLAIFDGLDEHEQPITIMNEIETLRKLAPNFAVIVTSRSLRIPENTSLPRVELTGFTEEQTRKQLELLGSSAEELAGKIQGLFDGNPLLGSLAAQVAKQGVIKK